jgi:hypothetical protein
LIRHLTDAAECHPDAHWPEQALRALRGLVHAHHQAREAGLPAIPARVRGRLIKELRQAVAVGLSQVPRRPGDQTKQTPARNLLECLHDRHSDVVAFCFDTRIPPTNNAAEAGLLGLVVVCWWDDAAGCGFGLVWCGGPRRVRPRQAMACPAAVTHPASRLAVKVGSR